jgi:hypothetical protein
MYALAQIAARQGDRAAALRWLGDYASTGMSRDLVTDSAFAALRGDAELDSIAGKLARNGAPISQARVVARLGDPRLLTEDVAWDAARRRFLVSSIHERKIVAVSANGATRDFASAGRDAWGIYALALDARHGRLWATTAAGPTCEGYDPADSGRTAVLGFDLASGRRIARIELSREDGRHVLGDLALARDGTAYVTASIGGGVYRLRPGANTFDTIAPSGTFRSPQMPVIAADGRRLLIPDYPRGLAAIDIVTGTVTWLGKPRTLASGGIDGLYREGRKLIAIQNGTSPHRVLELGLDPAETRITSWHVLEQASEWLGEPNHGTFVGHDFVFIGNSGWDRVGDDEVLQTSGDAKQPVLLKLAR